MINLLFHSWKFFDLPCKTDYKVKAKRIVDGNNGRRKLYQPVKTIMDIYKENKVGC